MEEILFLLMDQNTETLNSDPKNYYSSSNCMQNAEETQTIYKKKLFVQKVYFFLHVQKFPWKHLYIFQL